MKEWKHGAMGVLSQIHGCGSCLLPSPDSSHKWFLSPFTKNDKALCPPTSIWTLFPGTEWRTSLSAMLNFISFISCVEIILDLDSFILCISCSSWLHWTNRVDIIHVLILLINKSKKIGQRTSSVSWVEFTELYYHLAQNVQELGNKKDFFKCLSE